MVPQPEPEEMIAKDPSLPCFLMGIHPRPTRFFGREDILKTLDSYLLPEDSSQINQGSEIGLPLNKELRSFAICGLGGMGKTTLALEYAHSRKSEFDAIFWLGADDAKILAASFAQIAHNLGLEDESSDFAVSRDVAMGWLSEPKRKMSQPDTADNMAHWLIVFDNVDNVDVLDDFWPKFGRGSVLVTSRDPFAKHTLYVENGLDLVPLSKAESEDMMQGLTHVKADSVQKEALEEIVQKFGGLPLAINQMSGIFRRLRLSYTAFLKYYNAEGIQAIYDKHTDATDPHRFRSLATLWALDKLAQGTKALLQVICLLDPDGIPEDLLVSKSDEVMLENYPKGYGNYVDARSELISSSLISQNAKHESLSLHRLIQDTVKGMMTREETLDAYRTAVWLMVAAWPFQSMKEHHSIARFSICEPLFASVVRLKDGLLPFINTPDTLPFDVRLARLLNDTGW